MCIITKRLLTFATLTEQERLNLLNRLKMLETDMKIRLQIQAEIDKITKSKFS